MTSAAAASPAPSALDQGDDGSRTLTQRRFAFALMAIAGWCDAAGFMLFAQLYVSFMSGDGTQLGLKLGEAQWEAAGKFLAAQVLFVFGAAVGRYFRLIRPDHGRRNMLLLNVVLLGATALLGGDVFGIPAFAFAVVAMGVQNAIMTHEAGVPIGTMVTGTLARLGEALADRALGRPGKVFDNFSQWFFFVAGALAGTIGFRLLAAGSFWVPALASALLVPLAMRLPPMVERPRGELG